MIGVQPGCKDPLLGEESWDNDSQGRVRGSVMTGAQAGVAWLRQGEEILTEPSAIQGDRQGVGTEGAVCVENIVASTRGCLERGRCWGWGTRPQAFKDGTDFTGRVGPASMLCSVSSVQFRWRSEDEDLLGGTLAVSAFSFGGCKDQGDSTGDPGD